MIEGKTLQLRTVREKDLEDLYFFLNSIRLKGEYLPSELLSEQKFKKEFLQGGFWEEERGTLLIFLRDRILGSIWFQKRGGLESLEIGFYIFRPEERGKGVMSEALSLFTAYLFLTKKVERLEVLIPDYSKAALRVTQKNGFQFEGILRSALFHRGKYLDLCLYSLLRNDAKAIEKIYSHA